ncbi:MULTISPECIES: DUF305 domain-containing protein [Streptomyces]|uniref:DUF305 domain-containing protein n=1 Tax=Streptomyces TaxID=1883 RepID=UPI00093998BA|nr:MULTISPECIES: DUF305 domain-containing protein [unclassified Streptomyces]OKJ12891.1 hypothetical protein AMK20_11145 [Streptomyces sp. TSRI0261]QNQ38933.1 DUF305 domain-containing protein [Streptomyces sp. CB00271]
MERRKTRRVRRAAGAAVALALLFAGAATVASARGDGDGAGAGNARVPGASSADAGFARDMAVHHQQAVEMSFIVRDRTDDEDVRRLAYDIANTQANQRGMLLGWLDLWELPKVAPGGEQPMAWMAATGGHEHGGHGSGGSEAGSGAGSGADGVLMAGMASRSELARLNRLDGERAEVFFLQLMTDHHKGGVAMAEACASLCSVPAEQRLARGMVEGQQSELGLMRDMLAEREAEPRP